LQHWFNLFTRSLFFLALKLKNFGKCEADSAGGPGGAPAPGEPPAYGAMEDYGGFPGEGGPNYYGGPDDGGDGAASPYDYPA